MYRRHDRSPSAGEAKLDTEPSARETDYRALFGLIDEGFCVIEMLFDGEDKPVDYRFLEINPAFEKQTGLKDALGKRMLELEPNHEAHWFELYGRVAQTGEPAHFTEEARYLGGRTFYVHAYRFGEPEQRRVAILFEDISERWQAERRMDEFLATLAHELRNPLMPLRSALEVMRQGEPETATKAYALMSSQLAHITRLVDDLMDVSRITRGKVALRRAPSDVAAIARDAVASLRPRLDASGHVVQFSAPTEPVVVHGDPDRLKQVFSNLLDNAIDYTPAGGRFEISIERASNEAVVAVRDNGMGIAGDRLADVFDMFTQLDPPTGQIKAGLGVGLTLVKYVVALHGGEVAVQSGGPGLGAEFIVRLPLSEDRPVQVATDAKSIPTNPIKLRILVVDDNYAVTDAMGLLLGTWDHEVRIAHDGFQALDVAAVFAPHVVLLDIGMPRLAGDETAKRMRATPVGQGATLIALTGWGQDVDRRRTTEAGFDHHLVKPVEPDVLKQLLAEVRP